MRVVHVVTAFPRRTSDPITPWLVELVRRQREGGMDASVLAPAYRGGPPHETAGVPVQRFRYAPAAVERLTHDETVPDRLRRAPAYGLLVPLYLVGGVAAAFQLGRRAAPDIAHVHWPLPHALFGAAVRRGSAGKTAVVCSAYGVELNWIANRMRWLVPALRWSVRTADAVTAISSATAETIVRLTGREASIVPFAAVFEDDGRPVARSAFEGEGPMRLLFVGRLVERKGVEVLVRAAARLRERIPVLLTVVGEGEWERSIRQVISAMGVEREVRLTGYLSPADLAREYEVADAVVLPAVVDAKGDTEGLGVVLLEAMRFERPVVASKVGGIVDIVEDRVSGWLVPPGDDAALADTLAALFADPEQARAVAARGRAAARERFSWEAVLEATSAVYERARGRRRGDA